jgi:hypothetical protein
MAALNLLQLAIQLVHLQGSGLGKVGFVSAGLSSVHPEH